MGENVMVNATQPDQIEAFEAAREHVIEDVESGMVEAERWHGEVTDGEVLRILAEAYTGTLDADADAHIRR